MKYLKTNPYKSQLLLTSKGEASIKIDDANKKSSFSKKLLGVLIGNKLTFKEHVSMHSKKASNKLHALARISKNMTKDKRRNIMNTFFSSQFAYCSLVWMFQNRTLNNRINKLQEQALRLVHNDNTFFFYKLIQKKKKNSSSKVTIEIFRN